MNVIEILNHWGACLRNFALPMLWQSSLLMIILFALDFALRRRVRAIVRYALWLLMLIKLLLPPSFSSATSLAYWLPIGQPTGTSGEIPKSSVVRYTKAKVQIETSTPSAEMPAPLPGEGLSQPALLLIGWAIGTVGLFGCLIHRSRWVGRQVKAATDASDELVALLNQCGRQMQLRPTPRLKLAHSSMSPAVCGFGRPVILIPRRLAKSLSVSQLRAVLLHELAHVKRGDVWVNHAQTLLQIFYWWHPLLWLANAHIRRVREQAVDETVRVQMGAEGESYASTLLEVAKLALHRPLPALGFIGIVESGSALARRIKHLLDSPAPQTAKLRLVSLTAIILTGALLIPMAKGQRSESSKTSGQSSGRETEVDSNPARSVRTLAPGSGPLITITKSAPYIYLGSRAVTLDELKEELERATAKNRNAALSIRADIAAPVGKIVEVMDAAKSAGMKEAQLNSPQTGQIENKVASNAETTPTGLTGDKAATNQIVMIESKFFAIPHLTGPEKTSAKPDLVLGPSSGEKATPFLDADGVKGLLSFYASQGIQPFAAPRVTVVAGHEAELSVSKAEVQDGKPVLVGAALGIAPNVNGDSVGLQLRLRLGNLSESTNPSALYPPADLFDPSSRFVLSTNITVPNGKTAIVGRYIPDQNPGTNYMILVTPKLVAPDKPQSNR